MHRVAIALALIPALAVAQPAAETVPQPALVVADARIGIGVEDQELVGAGTAFRSSVEKIFCWTKVTGGARQKIAHVWYRDGRKVAEVRLPLQHETTRTWSYRKVGPELAGAWKVEVIGPEGGVLRTLEFTLSE
ncbi:MAG TPA: DUF2914 domain-containing protein [Anaeromyxobacteraceae bacterium]|nr:DUF2914 domain-containing protein [Anaeromyxobacteraceae bacterium]